MFGAGYCSKSYFGGGYFGPAPTGGTPWGVVEAVTENITEEFEKETNPITNEIGILQRDVDKLPEVADVYQESFTHELIEKALDNENKHFNNLQDKLDGEEDILLLMAIIEAHEN